MAEQTPLEQAEAFLKAVPVSACAWIGKAWGANGDERYLTHETVQALVLQIRYDEQRLAAAYDHVAQLQAVIADFAIKDTPS